MRATLVFCSVELIENVRYGAHVQSNLAWLAAAADGKEKVSTQRYRHCGRA